MSFKTGDEIEVRVDGNWCKRTFLAEHDGLIHYLAPGSTGVGERYWAKPYLVRAVVVPPPFKVGDRIRRPQDVYDRHVIHVSDVAMTVAWYDILDGGCTAMHPLPLSSSWALVVPEPERSWTSPGGNTYNLDAAYRDRDADVWRHTDFFEPNGEPLYATNPCDPPCEDDGCPVTRVERDYGPLVEVTA